MHFPGEVSHSYLHLARPFSAFFCSLVHLEHWKDARFQTGRHPVPVHLKTSRSVSWSWGPCLVLPDLRDYVTGHWRPPKACNHQTGRTLQTWDSKLRKKGKKYCILIKFGKCETFSRLQQKASSRGIMNKLIQILVFILQSLDIIPFV